MPVEHVAQREPGGPALGLSGATRFLDCLPDAQRGRRHIDVADAVFGQRVDNRIHDCGQRAGAARFPATLRAERVCLGRNRVAADVEKHRIRGARQLIIGERAGQQLAALVEDNAFHQRLANALDDAAMRLPFDQQRVPNTPEILTIVYLTTSITPVSGSISTSAMWQPLGKADGRLSMTVCTSSESGTSPGSSTPRLSCSARSISPIERSVPAMMKWPRLNSMSSTAASRIWAAIFLPFSIKISLA